MKKIVSVFVIASIGGITALGLNHLLENQAAKASSQLSYQAPIKYVNMPGTTNEGAVDFTTAAEMSVHSVVHVKTTH